MALKENTYLVMANALGETATKDLQTSIDTSTAGVAANAALLGGSTVAAMDITSLTTGGITGTDSALDITGLAGGTDESGGSVSLTGGQGDGTGDGGDINIDGGLGGAGGGVAGVINIGTAAASKVGFHGTPAVVQQTTVANASGTDAAIIDAIRDALVAYGLLG